MNLDDLTIGDAKRLARLLKEPSDADFAEVSKRSLGLQIIVLDRGFVYVGNVVIDGDFCLIDHAKNVRRWGTTGGLGELAEKGPLKETKLDEVGTVRAPMRAVIHFVECKEVAWKSVF